MSDTNERPGIPADRAPRDEDDLVGASAPEPSLARRMAGASTPGPFGPEDLTDAPPDDPGPGRVNAAAATYGADESSGADRSDEPGRDEPRRHEPRLDEPTEPA